MCKVSVSFRVDSHDFVCVSLVVGKKQVVKKLLSVVSPLKQVPISKGAKCSIQGKQYEESIANMCQSLKSLHLDVPLNTQTQDELGGCSAGQDVYLNFRGLKDVGVEVKRITPDWMQMSIAPDQNGKWCSVGRTKIPLASKAIFESFLPCLDMFPAPPFLEKDITYEEWTQVKSQYKDRYINVPNDTIAKAYRAKGAQYIQVLNYGLYHTGEDPCNFNVPMFVCEQRLRVRCKRHGKKDASGKHVPSSVMASLCPKLKTLVKSTYSLDNEEKLPQGITMYKV